MNRNVWKPKYNFRLKYITEAADFARYSFVLQSSLCCLDLNYCEYSKKDKPVNNFTAYKKENELREILGRLHLDIPSKLEFDSKDILVSHEWTPACNIHAFFPLFHPGRIVVPTPLHFNKFDVLIAEFIKQSNDKLGTMKRFLTAIRLMKLCEVSTWSLSLYEHFLPILHKECGQDFSELVVDVMKTFGCRFLKWAMHAREPDLEFFLYHAQKMGYDIWDVKSQAPLSYESNRFNRPCYPVSVPFYPVNECCIMGNLRNVRTLVKYGFNFVSSEKCLVQMKNYVFRCLASRLDDDIFLKNMQENIDIVARNIEKSGLSTERSCHLFLAVELFLFKIYVVMSCNTRVVKEALGCIWNTIAEPYFCKREIVTIFEGISKSHLEFCNFYSNAIGDGCFTENYNPRTLSHLSRCEARSVLGKNCQLPHGINKLNLPAQIELYLSLGL